jgi:hypothetical protein
LVRARYIPPTTPTAIADDINTSLGKYKAGALNIFGEWFSKPGSAGYEADPHYCVCGAMAEGNRLTIVFDVSGFGSEYLHVWDRGEYAWAPSLFQIRRASRVLLTSYGAELPVPDAADRFDCIVEGERVTGRVIPPPAGGWDPFSQMSPARPAVTLW